MMIMDANQLLELQRVCLQECKKKVLISIGATDLRNDSSFEMCWIRTGAANHNRSVYSYTTAEITSG